MDAVLLPPLPPPPSSATSSSSSMAATRGKKRTMDDDDAASPPASAPVKRRAPRSTAAEKAAKKSARMERNRIAAQVSRDRKKHQTEYLEARVAELEAQLASSSSSSTVTFSPLAAFTPLSTTFPSPPSLPTLSPEVDQLREENEALKTELALEKLQSQSLQIRLSSLETKFGRLEQLLSRSALGGGVKDVQPELEQPEAVPPVFDHPSSLPSSSSFLDALPAPSLDFSFPAVEYGGSALGLDLDLDLGSLDVLAPVAAPDPLVDPACAPPADVDVGAVAQADLAQAWADWANSLDVGATLDAQPFGVGEQAGEEFDLFDFLQQDVAAGHAAEAVC
ncbi:hypothetical protein JCM10207_003932 [Rhodosporidiobolus poonsookiae]